MGNKYYLLNTVLNMWFSKDGGLTNDFSNAKVYNSPNIQKPDYSLNNEDWKVVASKDIVKGMGEGYVYKLKKDSEPKPKTKTVYVLKHIVRGNYYKDRLEYTRMIEHAKRFDTVKEADDFITKYLYNFNDWCIGEYEVEDLKDEVVTNNPWDVKNYKPPFEDVIKDIADTYVDYKHNKQAFVDEIMSYYREYQPEEDVNDLIINMRQEIDVLKDRLEKSDTAFEYLIEHCAKMSSDSNTILKARNMYFDSWQESDRKYFQLVESIKKLLK